jgi:phosphatidylglycerophosphatase C
MAEMERQVRRPVDVVAAFDFDGTISRRDNFVPFLARFGGTAGAAQAFATSLAEVAGAGRSHWSRNAIKASVLRRLARGRDAADLDATALAFAREVIDRHLRAEAIERADWHRTQGHKLVIVSASLGAYLRPIAHELRFDAVLATELEVGDDGTLTGEMAGENVRGPEKARRLEQWMAEHCADGAPYVFAYGDSSGDRELWARADRAVRFGRRAHRGTG